MAAYRRELEGLDLAIWGHISDGNVHPNLIPRKASDVAAAKEALLELGDVVKQLGGCPLSEHGVGRHPVKQELVRRLYGDEGVDAMRVTKRALDPPMAVLGSTRRLRTIRPKPRTSSRTRSTRRASPVSIWTTSS